METVPAARALPSELYELCAIWLEEKMYSQAIGMLHSLATPSNPLISVPPAPVLTLLSTLVVHPNTTSRAASADESIASLQAISYISLINSNAARRQANFAEAFRFKRAQDSMMYDALPAHGNSHKRQKLSSIIDLTHTSSPTASSESDVSPISGDSGSSTSLNNALAGRRSLFQAAEGFWHVVGWSFNCAMVHPSRWKFWCKWLSLMLDILEAELKDARENKSQRPLGRSFLREIDPASRTGLRRIVKAIFADAGSASLAEFQEIWPGETKPRKEKEHTKLTGSRKTLNLDESQFGDYWDDDDVDEDVIADLTADSSIMNTVNRTSGRTVRRTGQYHVNMDLDHGLERKEDTSKVSNAWVARQGADALGGTETLELRKRLLGWVAETLRLQPPSKTSLSDFIDLVAEFLRPFSPSTLSLCIRSKSSSAVDDVTLSRIQMAMLNALMANEKIPVFNNGLPNQSQLQHWYLASNTRSHNLEDLARTAVILEALTRLLTRHRLLLMNEEFRDVTARGIDERAQKAEAILRKQRNKGAVDTGARKHFDNANAQLRWLVMPTS